MDLPERLEAPDHQAGGHKEDHCQSQLSYDQPVPRVSATARAVHSMNTMRQRAHHARATIQGHRKQSEDQPPEHRHHQGEEENGGIESDFSESRDGYRGH